MTGGTGSAVFAWASGDADGGTATITDFTAGLGGDVLDLSDVLDGDGTSIDGLTDLSAYLAVTSDGTDTTVSVYKDGSAAEPTHAPDQVIVLEGVDTDLASLIGGNNLDVDNV